MTKWIRKNLMCRVCGYKWVSRIEQPKKCPKCQSWHWRGASKWLN